MIRKTFGGLTQTEIGDICGVSKAAVANWERGSNLPGIHHGAIISRKFDVTLDYLFLGHKHTLKVEVAERLNAAMSDEKDKALEE